MDSFSFRLDVQDELLRLLFDKHRINLLKVPREDLDPGQVFLVRGVDGEAPVAYGPMALPRVVPGAVAPPISRDTRMADIEGASSNSTETRAEAGICAKVFARIWPGASLPDLSGKVEATGGKNLFYRFSEATRDSVDFAEISPLLGVKPEDLSFVDDRESFRLFIVTDVYRCSKIEMTWTDAHGKVIDAKVAMDELARLGGGRGSRSATDGKVTLAGGGALAFGVRLMELVKRTDGPGLVIRLDHTRLAVLGGEERYEDGGRTADDRDYVILVNPWGGDLALDLQQLLS